MASSKTQGKITPSAAAKKAKPKREVQVVSCPGAFPISTSKKRPREPINKETKKQAAVRARREKNKDCLDWYDTANEIRAYGATAFVGKQKRDYQDDEYLQLTGRHKKKQQVPLPIVRGIKKAAEKRDAKARQEAKEAGIVLPKAKKEAKKPSTTNRNYGPAPNIGFMKRGVFRMKDKKKENNKR